MIPFEISLSILVLAVASTINGAFSSRRWISFICLSLAAFGITGLANSEPAYLMFFMFIPQVIIIFAIAVLYCKTGQRFLLTIAGSILLVGFVLVETGPENYLDRAVGQLGLFVALILIPSLIFEIGRESLGRVDTLVSVQQFWLRVSLLAWCRENLVNVQHYDLFASSLEVGSAIAGGVFMFRLLVKRSTWMLTVKSLLSGVLLLSALTMDRPELKLLLVWTLIVGLVDLLPTQSEAKILRRMNLGGFGGASFWGMCLFLMSAPMQPWYRAGWVVLIFSVALSALTLPLPDPEESKISTSRAALVLTFFGLLLQAAFFGILLFWPEIKQLGV
jgi:hypothetical protein